MKLIQIVWPKDSEIYCITKFGRPQRFAIGTELGSFFILGWPYDYIKESSICIEEEFPKVYLSEPVEILHGVADDYSNDPLDVRTKTQIKFVIRFKITNYLSFANTVQNRIGLINYIQSPLISQVQQTCVKNSLAHNLKATSEINSDLLNKTIALTEGMGIEVLSVDLKIILSHDTHELINKFSKARADGFSRIEIDRAFYYAKSDGINKLTEQLGIDDKMLAYKIETIAQTLKKSNYNFLSLNEQEKDFTQTLMSMFYSSRQQLD